MILRLRSPWKCLRIVPTVIITRGYRLHGVTSFPIRRAESHGSTAPCSFGAQYLSCAVKPARLAGHFDIEIDFVTAL
jgi:hypothetical protein